MIEMYEKPLFWASLALVCLCCLCIGVNTVLALLVVLKTKKRMGKVYCGRCGEPLSETPTTAIALTDRAFFVYRCEDCQSETLLPQSSLNSR